MTRPGSDETRREHDAARLIAWGNELRTVHARLRAALAATRESLAESVRETLDTAAVRDAVASGLLADARVYCRGFCVALTRHHRGEDTALFPAIEAAHPELAPVLRKLEQDHSMLDDLLNGVEAAVARSASAAELETHLDGVAAIMENHFAYEERQLLAVLDTLALDADPSVALGAL